MWPWVQVAAWCLALVVASPTSVKSPDDIVNATVLLPMDLMYIVSAQRVKIVVEMALGEISQLLPGKKMFFQYYDDGCKGEKSLKTAFEVFDPIKHQKCHVLFGPTCEFSTEMQACEHPDCQIYPDSDSLHGYHRYTTSEKRGRMRPVRS